MGTAGQTGGSAACAPPYARQAPRRGWKERGRGRVSLRSPQSGRRGRHDAAQPAPARAAASTLRELVEPMFYEDVRIGQSLALGEEAFSRESILAYGRLFDPRIVGRAAEAGRPLAASGLHVAAAGMRRLVDTRSSLRAAMAERGETLPQLGVSPGFKGMRWPYPVHEGDIVFYSMETVSKRETSKPKWGLIGNSFRGVNQRQEEVLVFFSVVLIARRVKDM